MTPQEIAERLREWGVRVTPQRLAIAEAVLNSEDHPSVQQIFERVRDHFPSMTLATIYSTLDVLEKSGLIQELPFPQFSRYESNMDPHVNLVCIQCGNVIDSIVGQDAVVRLRDQISGQANFQVAWQRVDFHGWCRRCSAERHAQLSET
jgi:Fur family peroxide stress response transcriptional regulator